MNEQIKWITRYDKAIDLLPPNLRAAARFLSEADKAQAEEFRLRTGYLPTVLLPGGERTLGQIAAGERELTAVLEIVSAASVHAVQDSLKQGYITAKGGYRVGFGGRVTAQHNTVTGFQNLSSVVIRISKEYHGAADAILPQIIKNGNLRSALILSPPGGGKTTILRDIIRQCAARQRIAVADERGEISALAGGVPQMEIGAHTDVLVGCPKAEAVLMLLRTMNPEVVAMDEITAPADTLALESAANCGVTLLATAHALDENDLLRRPMYQSLLQRNLFERIVTITQRGGQRQYSVAEVGA